MKPISSALLLAIAVVSLHVSPAGAQAMSQPVTAPTDPGPAGALSVDELARLHAAVMSLLTVPTSDALATIQETQRLLVERLPKN
jgi:hypothetical protein